MKFGLPIAAASLALLPSLLSLVHAASPPTLSVSSSRSLPDDDLFANAINDQLAKRGRPEVLTAKEARELVQINEVLQRRSNPTGTYAPAILANGSCPAASTNATGGSIGYIRNVTSQEISANESDYVSKHISGRQSDWASWLSTSSPGPDLGSIPGGVENYTNTVSNLPRVGIAVSGGGYRAMLYGAGVLQGFDERNTTASQRGVGGVWQRADYQAGLSGGSWLTGSLAINDWATPQSLRDSVWDLDSNLVLPSDDKISFYTDLIGDVKAKRDLGFPTAITDYWGRALSYHLLNDTTYPNEGQATDFNDILNTTSWQNSSFPFPVVIADERESGELLIFYNTSIWEFNPYEFGTWDRIRGFFPINLLGSTVDNGEISSCVEGFENFGWVVGTSSTLFNAAFLQLVQSDGDSLIVDALEAVLGAVDQDQNDVSVVKNPLFGFTNYGDSSNISRTANLTMVDGGEDNQNVPLWPLLQPARELDFIMALDSSADTDAYWPNGSSLYQTHLRATQSSALYDYVPVPYFPSPATFVNRGLNTRPVFFGCNASNATNAATATRGVKAPIVAYFPNYPWTGLTNFSTYQLSYNDSESQLMLDNGVALASLGGNSTWSQCLACGMLERSFERSGVARPAECTACLDTWCWDGVENNTVPSQAYTPAVGAPAFVSDGVQSQPPSTGEVSSSSSSSSSGGGGSTDAASPSLIKGGNMGLNLLVSLSTVVILMGGSWALF